jgi:hypothetical protein
MNTKELQEDIKKALQDWSEERKGYTSDEVLDLHDIIDKYFKKLDDEPEEIITEGDKKLKSYLANQKFFNDTYDMEGY